MDTMQYSASMAKEVFAYNLFLFLLCFFVIFPRAKMQTVRSSEQAYSFVTYRMVL